MLKKTFLNSFLQKKPKNLAMMVKKRDKIREKSQIYMNIQIDRQIFIQIYDDSQLELTLKNFFTKLLFSTKYV